MSVYKSPRSPHWQYDFQFQGARFHGSTGCAAKRDAERFEAKRRREVALGNANRPPITLNEASALYWAGRAKDQPSAKTTAYQLENLCTILGKGRMLAGITLSDMDRYCAKRGETVGPASVNREWQLARRVWRYAMARGFDVPLPGSEHAIDWRHLGRKEPQERVRELLPEEERRLFAKLPVDLARVVEFAMLSGQRKASVISLLRERVDLDGKRASVIGKGDIWHTFPLTPRLVALIEDAPMVEGCPFVFTYLCTRPSPARHDRPRRFKGRRYPFSKQGWDRQWRKAKTDAGVGGFRFHDLRHTSATRIVRATGSLKVAQKLLNHSNIATTARYAHATEDDIRTAMIAGEGGQVEVSDDG